MKVKKVSKPALHADTYSVACVVNNNAEVLENALDRIKVLEQETFKNAYIQVVKERDIAIGQLNELGYSLGEKIRPCDKAAGTKEKVIAEIDKQGEWLAEAGYNAYNVNMAFNSLKLVLAERAAKSVGA